MNYVIIFAVISLFVGLVSIYGRSPALRASTYAAFVVGLVLFWFASSGLPRPEYFRVPHGTVLGYRLDEPKAIYLWLIPDGSTQPLALELPWRTDVASNLVDAAQRRDQGDSLKMKGGDSRSGIVTKPIFYVSHVKALPAKMPER